jgi:hypothetical protein
LADSTTTMASSTVLAPSITGRARVVRSGSTTAIESGDSRLAIAHSRDRASPSREARARAIAILTRARADR